jgi:hypothetical protein
MLQRWAMLRRWAMLYTMGNAATAMGNELRSASGCITSHAQWITVCSYRDDSGALVTGLRRSHYYIR